MFLQLGLRRLAGTAEFAVHDGFHNHPRSVLIGGHGNFEVHIAIGGVDAGFLEKSGGHMENLELPPGSWRVGQDDGVLRPTENGIHTNFLRGDGGNGNVFRYVPEIQDVRLNRQAFA
jgi:hypothetical protein